MVIPEIKHYSTFWKEVTYGGSSLIYQLAKDGILPHTGVDYVEVKPNTELKPHYHTKPTVLIIILQGKGLAWLGQKQYAVKTGDVITIPPNTKHGFATQKEKLVFISIQSPAIYGKEAEKDTHFVS